MAPMKVLQGTLDPALCERVQDRANAFAEAFEDVAQHGTLATCEALTQASDELMRATARVLIELTRLVGRDGL
jgi:alpha-D-ribose 1-methylphosphonate 5-triphosphate synthase subunit PhnH